MKKFVKIISVVLVLVVCFAMLVACKPDNQIKKENTIGKEMPNVAAKVEINKDMDAKTMLMAAIENYYAVDYVGKTNFGKVVVTILGQPVTQVVDAVIEREGVADDNAKYYVDNRSASSFVRVWEETYINGINDVKFRNATKGNIKFDKKTNNFEVKQYEKTQLYSNDYTKYVNDKKNDPTKIWGYNVNENSISEASAVTKKGNEYTFSVTLNIDKNDPNCAIVDYFETMMYMLNQSVKVEELAFKGVTLEFTVWENGLFKNFSIKENYLMNVINILKNTPVELNSFTEFTYDKTELSNRVSLIKELTR